MSVPTVASLSAALGPDLAPVEGAALPRTPITAVHLSELLDPASYLSGGELLLTVGLALPKNKAGCRRYVNGLKRAGVSALAIGLGPVHQEVPRPLVAACAEGGLPLLVVPVRTPFLKVTKAYWSAVARSKERHLSDAIAMHRSLVDAAASADPVAQVLKRLAVWLDGWAATLGTGGDVDRIHPADSHEAAEQLQSEVRRLQLSGVHSSASFVAAGSVVVVFPLAVAAEVVGYLAVGTRHRLDASQRAVVVGAGGLLSLEATRAARRDSAEAARREDVLALVEDGHVAAAERLASRSGLAPLPRECRVLTLRGRHAGALEAVVRRWCGRCVGTMAGRGAGWFLVPAAHPELAALRDAIAEVDAGASGVVSDLVRLEDVGAVRARQESELPEIAPGTVRLPRSAPADRDLVRRLDGLAAAGQPVVEALAAYLRAHGQWEVAARASGVHRNTLRYRVDRARAVLDVDLDDVEVTSRLWLLMSSRGMT